MRDCKSLYSTRPDCKSARTGRKWLFPLFILFCVSCDVTRPFLINEEYSNSVQTSCGEILFRAYSFGYYESNLIVHFNGVFTMKPKSLKFNFEPDAIDVHHIKVWRNNKEMTDLPDTIRVEGEEEFRFEFRYKYKSKVKKVNNYAEGLKMKILSSDFISCNDSIAINDMVFLIKKESFVKGIN